jgi:two-component system, OmpR family, response regulator
MGGASGVSLVVAADPFIFFSSSGSSIGSGVSAVRLLVVEDSVKMAAVLKRGLEEEGYAVDVALTGEEGLWMAVEYPSDVIVLDVMLPDMDGFELCRRLRERGQWAPVLMLTARGAVADRVRGLDAGADDYLTKPFSFHELAARTRALVRRGAGERPATLAAGDLSLDPATRAAHRGGAALDLSAREFALLEYFMRHPGEVLSRTRLIEHVWDFAYDGGSNIVDVYVRYLREKIDRPFGAHSLETVRGAGYRLRGDSADARAD